jgi:hypothetical protein
MLCADLQQRFPLPFIKGDPEWFDEVVAVDGLAVHSCGLAAAHDSGATITGAAADLLGVPVERSFFELLERSAVLGAAASRAPLPLRTQDGAPAGFVDPELVFPTTGAPALQRFSTSNGAAVQLDWRSACERARRELVERDRVLRRWYGDGRPEPLALPPTELTVTLGRHYELGAWRFTGVDAGTQDLEVVGVIGLPRDPGAPLLTGFACRSAGDQALAAALAECLQHIAFGWGEPQPGAEPPPEPTPEFHLDFYNYAPNQERLRSFLAGSHEGQGPPLPIASDAIVFVDLTPESLVGRLAVARALNPTAVPLAFGLGHPWFASLPEAMRVQPIA